MFLFLGFGYVAKQFTKLENFSAKYIFTRSQYHQNNNCYILNEQLKPAIKEISQITHILISIPPAENNDISLDFLEKNIAQFTSLKWIGYLSTTGVYGDHKGEFVDESALLLTKLARSLNRVSSENRLIDLCNAHKINYNIFRLAAIYGEKRNILDKIYQQQLTEIISKPAIYSSRIHIADIIEIIKQIIDNKIFDEIFNLSDNQPCLIEEYYKFAFKLFNNKNYKIISLAECNKSEFAKSFYLENKRVSNHKVKKFLNYEFIYPSYREGLTSIFQNKYR